MTGRPRKRHGRRPGLAHLWARQSDVARLKSMAKARGMYIYGLVTEVIDFYVRNTVCAERSAQTAQALVTEAVYAERDERAAMRIAAEIG